MLSVGKVLRGARLAQQLDLPTVSVRTKISVRYLEAIEADDRRSLPSGFFYKSFVDQYARFLGLDTPAINAEVDRLLSADAPLPLPGYESVVSRNVPPMKLTPRLPQGPRLGIFGGLNRRSYWMLGNLRLVAPRQAERLSKRAGKERPLRQRVPRWHLKKLLRPKELCRPTNQQRVAPGYKVLLDLMAREETWLSITSEGKRLFSGVLAPNQTKTVEGKESATMKVGNAAGLEVRLNGKLLGPLGGRGQVLVVVFTPDKFQIVPPMPREGD